MLRSLFLALGLLWLVEGTASAAPFCATSPGAAAPSVLANAVDSALGPPPVADVGPLAQTLADELQSQICADFSVSSLLPATCASPSDIRALRSRLAVDLMSVPRAALADRLSSLPPEQRLAVAYLSALSNSVEPAEVAHRVAHGLGLVAEECSPPTAAPSDRVALAVLLFWTLSQDAATARLRTQQQAELLVIERLQAARGVPPSELELGFARQLAAHSVQVFAWHDKWRANPSDRQTLTQLLLAEFKLFEHALSLSHAQAMTLPAEAWATVSAVINGNVERALDMLRTWLVSRAQLDVVVLDQADKALRFARARTREDAERIVRGEVLGPWSVSASAGVPRLQSDDFNIVGEGTIGYHGDIWGLAGGGGISVLEFESPEYLASTIKLFGNGDGWFSIALGESTMFDLRATFDVVAFDSDTTVIQEVTLNGAETTLLVRGGGLLGVRHQTTGFGIGGWVGGSAQLEGYDQRSTIAQGNNPTQLDDSDSVSGMAQGRARMQWSFVPDVLALRLSVDGKLYSMARLSSSIDTTVPLDEILVETDDAATQLEAIGRAYLDLELLRLFEFVPGAGVGIDHYQLAVSGQETQVATIPVFLLGVRRATF